MEALIEWLNHQRAVIHMLLHVMVPVVVWIFVWIGFRLINGPRIKIPKESGWQSWLSHPLVIMLMTMSVDIDHLLATPIYEANRCSILFHPLHTTWPMLAYGAMLIWPLLKSVSAYTLSSKDRVIGWVGAGLVIHMSLDSLDCLWMRSAL